MLDFVIIGAAQAGLSMAYYLKKQEKNILLLDKGNEIGYSWLNRWDSLQLFTPSEYNNMPGFKFPKGKGYYPSKFEVANYFKLYVKKYNLPLQLDQLVTKIEKKDGLFYVYHNQKITKTKGIIVATGPFHIPYTPPCHQDIDKNIIQTHSNAYKNTKQLQDGPALVVGDGDSGYQILDEISQEGRKTYFSGDTKVKTLPQELLGKTLWWWLKISGFLSINRKTWLGKRVMNNRQPIIGTNVKAILKRENVITVGRTNDANINSIETEKKVITDVKNIVWATGYRPNFEWIKGLETTTDGYPKNNRGISRIKNLYFIGLPWLHTRGSATLGGVGKDAKFLHEYIKNQ